MGGRRYSSLIAAAAVAGALSIAPSGASGQAALACPGGVPPVSGPPCFTEFGVGTVGGPHGVAVDQQGLVYVADTNNDLIRKFSNTGTLMASYGPGPGGTGNIFLEQPIGVAVGNQVSNPDIYVVNQGTPNPAVAKADSNGNTLLNFGVFNAPTAVDVDETNHVWVTDAGDDILVKFAADGTLLNVYGKPGGGPGNGPGEFDNPLDVANDPAGDTYVADHANTRVQKLDPFGMQIWQTTGAGIGMPAGVEHDLTGNNWVTDQVGDVFSERNDTTGAIIGSPLGGTGTAVGEFDGPYGIAVDCILNVFVADQNNSRIQRYGIGQSPPCVAPDNTRSPELAGQAQVGSGLALDRGDWTGVPIPTLSQRWQRCSSPNAINCADITGERGLTYTVTDADRGFRLRGVVVATNTEGTVTEATDMTPPVPTVPITPLPPVPPSSPFTPTDPSPRPPEVKRTGLATFDVTCNPTGRINCEVKADLVGPGPPKRKGKKASASASRIVALATAEGQVRFTQTGRFRLKLTRAGRALVKSGRSERAVLRVFVDGERRMTARLQLNRKTAKGFK